MSLARVAKRRDANERYIVEALERVGAEVWITDRPADLLVWFRRRWYVLEVKMPHGKLSKRQQAERAEGLCEGIQIVRKPLDALRAIGAVGEESSLGIEADPRLAQET